MRTVTAIVLLYCLAVSNATFRLFKSKTRAEEPIGRYRAVNYLRAPVEIFVPLRVPAVGNHVGGFRVSPPLPPPPIPAYADPQAYAVPVYQQTLAVGYSAPPVVDYSEHFAAYVEPSEQVELYSGCDETSGVLNWK